MSKRQSAEAASPEAGFDLKEGTFAVLRAGKELLAQKGGFPRFVDFEIGGHPYTLRYSLGAAREDIQYQIAIMSVIDRKPAKQLPKKALEYEIILSADEVSRRRWQFDYARNQDEEFVEINASSGTRPGYEGQGIALGLALLSDALIEDVLPRGMWATVPKARSLITDSSHGQSKAVNRQGWASTVAGRLGYDRQPQPDDVGRTVFVKEFPIPTYKLK